MLKETWCGYRTGEERKERAINSNRSSSDHIRSQRPTVVTLAKLRDGAELGAE